MLEQVENAAAVLYISLFMSSMWSDKTMLVKLLVDMWTITQMLVFLEV
jgi:hypothetical protein